MKQKLKNRLVLGVEVENRLTMWLPWMKLKRKVEKEAESRRISKDGWFDCCNWRRDGGRKVSILRENTSI